MLIINGAGSLIAKNFILSKTEFKILAISRSSVVQQVGVENVNLNDTEALAGCLEKIEDDEIVWVNFQALKHDDLLINNSLDHVIESFDVNFMRNFMAAKVLIPKMIKSRRGTFIFFDSVRASMGDVGCMAYSCSKAANRPLMQSIVAEYSRFNITCNIVSIGYAETPMWLNIDQQKRKNMLKDVPGKKMVELNEVNNTIDYFLQNRSINGEIIKLDGGMHNPG